MTAKLKKSRHSGESRNPVPLPPIPVAAEGRGERAAGELLAVREGPIAPYLAKLEQSLSNGWRWTTLGEAFKWASGGTPKRDNAAYYGGSIPWVIIGDLNDGVVSETETNITQAGLDNSSAKWVEPGSVLIAMYGSIGKLGIAGVRLTTNQAIAHTKPTSCAAKYLFWYLASVRDKLKFLGKGGTQQNISLTVLKTFLFLLAPPNEQRRIVAELETQLTRLDAGVTALKRVQVNLKRYRASVLKAACEGRLVPTEAELARREGRAYESGAELLHRLLIERQKQWFRRGKYKTPISPDTGELPAPPDGWTWASAEQCTSIITDGEHITPERTASGIFLLSARNVLNGRLSLTDVDFVPQHEYDRIAKRLVINSGDVLLSCSGSVGRSTVAPDGLVFTLVRSVAVLKPLASMGRFLSLAIRSPLLQQQIAGKKTQTAQANIFQGKIKTLCIPLPPLLEQHRIVAEVERLLSVVEELEATITANLKRAERLRQSVLSTAFVKRGADTELAPV